MNELENLGMILFLLPLMYISMRFMWHMHKLKDEAMSGAIKKALEEEKSQTSSGTETQ